MNRQHTTTWWTLVVAVMLTASMAVFAAESVVIETAAQNEADRQASPTHKVNLSEFTPNARAAYERINWQSPQGAAHIVGFNFQPSWAKTGITAWIEKFDAEKYRTELANGKRHFPLMTAVRLWFHYGAWTEDPEVFKKNATAAFAACRELDLLIIPTMTSYWPGNERWGLGDKKSVDPNALPGMDDYFLALHEASRSGANVLVWDICNEPHPNEPTYDAWLRGRIAFVKKHFANNAVTIGMTYRHSKMPQGLAIAHLLDLLGYHYYITIFRTPGEADAFAAALPEKATTFRAELRNCLEAYAKEGLHMPVISTECCWGSSDDVLRAKIVDYSLSAFVDTGLGFLPHALQESLAPDLHRPEFGPVGVEFMGFIMMDGSLRPGHDIYNKYAEMAVQGNKKGSAQGK